MDIKRLPYLLIMFLLVVSCDEPEAEVKFDPTTIQYLPLQVGNYWSLEPENSKGNVINISITDEVLIHGKNYFKFYQLVIASSWPSSPIEKYYYLRRDEYNWVYLLSDSAANIDLNILRLGAPDGYQWQLSSNRTVSVRIKSDEINGNTKECKLFLYDDADILNDEHQDTFAWDIGYWRIDEGRGRLSRLSFARINGVDYDFRN